MNATQLKKIAAGIVGTGIIYVVLAHFGWIPSALTRSSVVPQSFDLPTDAGAPIEDSAVEKVPLPSTTPSTKGAFVGRINVWAWNAQMGLFFANGGPVTTTGSLMEKHGVRLQIIRQDDTEKTKPQQIKFAQQLHDGVTPSADAIPFTIIMGDGAAQYLAAQNKVLSKLGPEYVTEIIGAVGYSRGEDAFMGPQAWKDDPAAMRGGVTAGYLRDGDWNLAQYVLAQNGIKNNPDEHTWDADAMNWVSADDYIKAAAMYTSGYCEDRDVVRAGKKTGETHRACVQGVVTWTPGDVNIAKRKGGLVKILSTKENQYQMPSVIVGIRKFNQDHAKQVREMLAAAWEGGDQVKHHETALQRAAQASYAIYKEESAGYWLKYYKGVVESDRTQQPILLGGSTVMNLADNLVLFGLASGAGGIENSVFKATYEGFGRIAQQQYPSLVPSFPSASDAVNTSLLAEVANTAGRSAEAVNADLAKFDDAGPIESPNVVAKRDWTIQFETGKATFTPAALETMQDLYTRLSVGSLGVDVQGHTDNVGNPASNQALSEARAFAVKHWLQEKAPLLFPEKRVTAKGFGDSRPLESNATSDGRAKNRRVTIILGTKS